MSWAELGQTVLITVYTFSLVMVSIYGLHRYVIVWLYYRNRKKAIKPAGHFDELPRVTVQLPMYNERLVARRIIEKACEIDYPGDKLQIQVIDDSTDDTVDIARQAVAEARAKGFDIEYVHRDNREGYKAGALANGLKTATGEFVTIFDADFVPEPSILQRSVHYFTDPKICVVQTRWDHINREDSMLTRSQAIFLDAHFAIEHVARNRSERFMSFNGTAGTWRRTAIEDAGGWHHDTLTEDLDLSYRAQLKGWKFVFLPDLTAPAELPPIMSAFKAQQFRWTKGGTQNALKLLPRVWLSKAPLKVKIEAFFHLTGFTLHLYMAMLVLFMFPAMYIQCIPLESGSVWRGMFDMTVFSLATMSAAVFYTASQVELAKDWRVVVKYMPFMMALGIGLCVSNTKGVIEAFIGKKSSFVRTPKYADHQRDTAMVECVSPRKHKWNWVPYVEFLLGLYMATSLVISLTSWGTMTLAPFLMIFTFGFFYVSVMSFHCERVTRNAETPNKPMPAESRVAPDPAPR